MLRILVACLLALTALATLAPPATAVAICTHQEDYQDSILGDDPVTKVHCTTENVMTYDCDADVRVEQTGKVVRSTRCEPLICTTYCDPYFTPLSASAAPPCTVVGNPALDGGVGVTCSAQGAECSATAATFGTMDAFLSPDAGCSKDVGLCEVGPQVDDGEVDRVAVECQGFIQCVTEPCPGSGGIKI